VNSSSASLAYVSLSVPYGVRVSRIYESGGELVYGFGYFDVRSPSGYAVRARVAARRDPMELIALNVPDVNRSAAFFQDAFGMTASKPLDQNGYAPKSPPGSKLMSFGEVKETLCILLQPAQAVEDVEQARKMGEAFVGVSFAVGGGDENFTVVRRRVASALQKAARDAPCVLSVESYEAWETEVAKGARALPFKYNEPPPA
jgi:catechol 2,3-dioxygenase-like lactoylglutathione lyase family enzyme